MTEREFNHKVEEAAQRLEQRMEGAADRFEKALERKWEQKPFQVVIKLVSLAAEVVLLIGSAFLFRTGHKSWATLCFWLGMLGIVWALFKRNFFRRKQR